MLVNIVACICLHILYVSGQTQKVWTDPPKEFQCMDHDDFPECDRELWNPVKKVPLPEKGLTIIDYYPFMVSIIILNKTHCGGVLYDEDMVTTTASCLQLFHNNRYYRENPKALKIRIASNHSRFGGEVLYGTEIFFHPDYNPKTLNFNVAAIRLYKKVLNNDNPRCLELFQKKTPLPSNVRVAVLSWGENVVNDAFHMNTGYLWRQDLFAFPNYYCRERYGKDYVTEYQFCAGYVFLKSTICDHDSGAAAILDGQLIGLASSGSVLCRDRNSPTIFTHIGHSREWLERVAMSKPRFVSTMPTTTLDTQSPSSTPGSDEEETDEPSTVPPAGEGAEAPPTKK